MPEWSSEFAGTFSFRVHTFPHSSWQVGPILCSAQTPCLCSAKGCRALQRGRDCFLGNQTSEKIHSQEHAQPQESVLQDHLKGQWCFQTARAGVPITEDTSIQCQMFHNRVNTERLESFKANPEFSF